MYSVDPVFEEEKKQLESVVAEISSEIELHEGLYEQYLHDFNNYPPDSGLAPSKSALRSMFKNEEKRVEELKASVDEPYFGRMDLDVEGDDKTETYYIGKKDITIHHNQLVVDWRSEVGNYFYLKSEKTFTINEYVYSLVLRRSLEVKKGKLIDYNTEFDETSVTLEGDVMDPFLLTVLRDKRRQRKLTDIITSIQQNQNEIIRKPRNDQFIVQGCAGSGKTMIMLHRLSFLMFNNRDLNWDNAKIITPNKTFVTHINDLSRELGLDKIERLSVDEYYVRLLKGYSEKNAVSSDVVSEKSLNPALLREVYSTDFYFALIELYHSFWNDVISSIRQKGFDVLLNRFGQTVPNYESHNWNTYSELALGARVVKKRGAEVPEDFKKIQDQYQSAQQKHKEYENNLIQVRNEIEILNRAMLSALDLRSKTIEQTVLNLENEKLQIDNDEKKLIDTKHTLNNQLNGTRDFNKQLEENYSHYLSLDSLKDMESRGDDIAKIVLNTEHATTSILESLYEEYRNTPELDSTTKKQIEEQIKKKTLELTNSIKADVDHIKQSFYEYESNYEKQLVENEEQISEKKQQKKDLNKRLKRAVEEKELIEQLIRDIQNFELENIRNLLNSRNKDYNLDLPPSYLKAIGDFLALEKRVDASLANIEKLEGRLSQIESKSLSNEEERELHSIIEEIERLTPNSILRDTFLKQLSDKYKKAGEKYTRDNHRHKLYIKLLFASLYYPANSVRDNFLNIDEAQDISVAEYMLLRSILGERCIFNLYGDTKQLVYSYKGITDWNSLSEVVSPTQYFLNENYRNTLQITEFCNSEFASNVYPIGISGDDVMEMKLSEAINWLQELRNDYPDYRCAIIFRHGSENIADAIRASISQMEASWYEVDNSKISIVSVELSKGLEFDAVIAITDGMSENERYTSYTRALNHLCVVREMFVDASFDASTEVKEHFLRSTPNVSSKALLSESNDDDQDTHNKDVPFKQDAESDLELISDDAIAYVANVLSELFNEPVRLNKQQREIISCLDQKRHTVCSGSSGNMKSILFFAMTKRNIELKRGISLITAESQLQENELVMAERFGLKCGCITEGFDSFLEDVKRDKYDIIFIPYDFFSSNKDAYAASSFFKSKVRLWGIDHPLMGRKYWEIIKSCGKDIDASFYLMSKEGFDGVDINGYAHIKFPENNSNVQAEEVYCKSQEDKLEWICNNLALFDGNGLIYCDTQEMCKLVSSCLRKKRIKAPEYTNIENTELIHYLTNGFTNGSIPILVTTHLMGKNLSCYKMNFILHVDVPKDRVVYKIHSDQVNEYLGTGRIIDLIDGETTSADLKMPKIDKSNEAAIDTHGKMLNGFDEYLKKERFMSHVRQQYIDILNEYDKRLMEKSGKSLFDFNDTVKLQKAVDSVGGIGKKTKEVSVWRNYKRYLWTLYPKE